MVKNTCKRYSKSIYGACIDIDTDYTLKCIDRIFYDTDTGNIYFGSYVIYDPKSHEIKWKRKFSDSHTIKHNPYRLDITFRESGKHRDHLLKIIEDKIFAEMKKNPNISVKELEQKVGYGRVVVEKYYLKIRRQGEIFSRK